MLYVDFSSACNTLDHDKLLRIMCKRCRQNHNMHVS
jgi:hypothetical protein